MSALKFPPALPRPSRADRSRLPAALTALLAGLLALQFALSPPIELPEGGGGRPFRLPAVSLPPVFADPAIIQRPLFAPNRRASAADGPAASDALSGALAVGSASVRGAVRLFLRTAEGPIVVLAPGSRIDGWRLDAVTPAGAQFSRGVERRTIPISSTPQPRQAPPGEGDEPPAEEESQ